MSLLTLFPCNNDYHVRRVSGCQFEDVNNGGVRDESITRIFYGMGVGIVFWLID